MSRDKRARMTGRRGDVVEPFAGVPVKCMRHQNYITLSYRAKVMLFELALQYRGHNNGDISISAAVLKPRGWASKTTIFRARDELEQAGWIVTTRYGSRNRCSLYALTYWPIDHCKGKHDVPEQRTALDFWKLGRNPWLIQRGRAAAA